MKFKKKHKTDLNTCNSDDSLKSVFGISNVCIIFFLGKKFWIINVQFRKFIEIIIIKLIAHLNTFLQNIEELYLKMKLDSIL